MTLANSLTLGRLFLLPVWTLLLMAPGTGARRVGLAILVFAALLDLFDGWAARVRRECSDLGRILDPLSDRAWFLTTGWCAAVLLDLPLAPIILLTWRELVVEGLRALLGTTGTVLAAGWLGKCKTVSAMAAMSITWTIPALGTDELGIPAWVTLLWWITATLSLVSGVLYLRNGWSALRRASRPDPG